VNLKQMDNYWILLFIIDQMPCAPDFLVETHELAV